jgi:hypothetical protein
LKLLWTKYEVGKAEPVLTLEIHDLQQLLLWWWPLPAAKWNS